MSGFILKCYSVGVDDFSGVQIFAKSRAQASYRAFEGYSNYDDSITFKEFLKKRPRIRVDDMPEGFGKVIHVNPHGDKVEPVFYMGKRGNTVSYVRPNQDHVVCCHELDVVATPNL